MSLGDITHPVSSLFDLYPRLVPENIHAVLSLSLKNKMKMTERKYLCSEGLKFDNEIF